MSGFDFTEALNEKATDVEKPPVLPVGTYVWTVIKEPKVSQTASGEWTVVEFPVKSVSADTDVDEDELAEYGNPAGAIARVAFMSPTDPDREAEQKTALWRIKNFLGDILQVDCADDATISEMMAASPHCQFYATVAHRMADDGEQVFIDLKNIAALD